MEKTNRLKEETTKPAEKRCRKILMGEADFRPTLKNLGKTWELWKLVRKDKEGSKTNRVRIKRKYISLGLRKPISLTTEEVSFK